MIPIRLGVVGLGRAFMLMRPTFVQDPRVTLAAAADPRPAARARFTDEHGPAFDSVEALYAHPGLDAIYVASPHQHHLAHVRAAAAAGLHVLVEKPMALTLDECQAMIDATDAAGVALLVGHSHGFDRPYAHTRARSSRAAASAPSAWCTPPTTPTGSTARAAPRSWTRPGAAA